MKVAVILGTRPEIIKMSGIVRELAARSIDYFTIHTGQHYSYLMDWIFFEQLSVSEPKYNLGIRSKSPMHQGDHTGRMLAMIEEVLLKEKPDVVLVHGDTNTTLAGALCVSKLKTAGLPMTLCHVEAGLRSFDRRMPEEINRMVADSLSDMLFAPTELAKSNLLREGFDPESIVVVGNTVVDAVDYFNKNMKSDILGKLGLESRGYFLLTAHRQDNVDIPERFSSIMEAMSLVSSELGKPVIYPVHPRSRKMMSSVRIPAGVRLIDPLGYADFMQLQKHAAIVFTDSGGVQEESCILGTPCVTLRDNTERPETLQAGSNVLAGISAAAVMSAARQIVGRRAWNHPYGSSVSSMIVNRIGELQ